MESLKDIIETAIKAIEGNARLFYQQKSQEGFAELDSTLNILMQAINQVLNYQSGKDEKLADEQLLNLILTQAMKAMEDKDIVLLADILVYEINQILEECKNRI